ncbi:MAG: hypothetical protein ACRDKW_00320, partial [Actinomycetota bacterium]
MHATVRLAVLAAGVAVAAALLPAPPWAVLVLIVLVPAAVFAVEVRAAPAPGRLSPALEARESVEMGEDVEVALRVRNPATRSLHVALRVAAPPSLGRRPDRILTDLAPATANRFELRVTPGRRGFVDLGPVTVRTYGPWGMAGRQATLPVRHRFKVY